jgi:porin
VLWIFLIIAGRINGQDESRALEPPVSLEASYTGDIVRNFSGGIKKGTSYLGLVNLRVSLNTEGARLWKGGQVFINAANAHGGNPSADLTGDFHTISNIEADEITYIHELWYRQTLGKVEVIIGLQDLNTDFVSTEYGSTFINSTFGTPSTIADNVPSPIFPFTSTGISLKWNFPETGTWKFALFDGLPTALSRKEPRQFRLFNKEEGVFGVTEYQLRCNFQGRLAGSFRAGTYFHTKGSDTDADNTSGKRYNSNYGFYLIADQMISREPGGTGGLGIFAQVALSPKAINSHHQYFGLGVSYSGLFYKSNNDKLGIAFTHAGFKEEGKQGETVIELTYQARLTKNIFIQPDLQYVINPEGTEMQLRNATVGFIRFGVTL